MAFRELLYQLVNRRSTRLRLRGLQAAVRDLYDDLAKQLRYGRDLKNHCHGRTGLLLHVGCGELVQPGWVNIDTELRAGAFYWDAVNGLPFEEQTVRHIHAEHFLEHLEVYDGGRFLAECHRVLEIGGILRIIVPDAEKYMKAYATGDHDFFEPLVRLGGTAEPLPTKAAICNQMFRMGGDHRFAWDFETLEYTARQIGFSSIDRSHHNDASVPYCIDGQERWRAIESLYVNLTR
jgi:hypothetical protein